MQESFDIQRVADRITSRANAESARIATERLQEHLTNNGIEEEEAQNCTIEYNDEIDQFVPKISDRVRDISFGTEGASPTGVIQSFYNRINFSKIHSEQLFLASKSEGLLR